jgi:membrane-associated phospholipid phosphatase
MLDDVPDLVLAGGLVALLTIAASAYAGSTRSGRWLEKTAMLAGGRGWLILTVLAAALFLAIAEDVLQREHDEVVLRLDARVQITARALVAQPAVRTTAEVISHMTGEGVAVGVFLVAAGLLWTGRRRPALLLAGGTLGAWLLDGGLKLAFRIPRPAGVITHHLVSRYGFPSGHALVTVVGCGFATWILGQGATRRGRLALYAGAVVATGLAGTARIVQGGHWLSDIIAGCAIGVICLNVMIVVDRRGATQGARGWAWSRAEPP